MSLAPPRSARAASTGSSPPRATRLVLALVLTLVLALAITLTPNPNPNQTRLRTELYGSGGVASADLAAALGPQRGEFETLTLP